jgi:hypothetical protein
MISIKLIDLIPEIDNVQAFMAYRAIDDWLNDHVPKGRWRFDYSHTICVCGVDIPGRIFFYDDNDAVAFRLRHKSVHS